MQAVRCIINIGQGRRSELVTRHRRLSSVGRRGDLSRPCLGCLFVSSHFPTFHLLPRLLLLAFLFVLFV